MTTWRRRARTVLLNSLGLVVATVGLAVPVVLVSVPPAAAAPPPEVMLVQPATANGCLAPDPGNPAVARLRVCGTDAAFHWVHEWDGRLRNVGVDRCLSSAATQGATPSLEACSDSSTRWDTKDRDGGYHSFRVRGTDRCLDFPASIGLGNIPRMWHCPADTNHDWAVFPLADKPQLLTQEQLQQLPEFAGVVLDCGGKSIAEWYAEGHGVVPAGFGNALPGGLVICGTVRPDVINAGTGDDTIFGGFGSDVIDGGSGDDTIWSGAGEDEVRGGPGNDHINGGLDADELRGGAGNDVIVGGAGDDVIHGEDGDDKLIGFGGSDHLLGGAEYDSLCDTDGNADILDGGSSFIPELGGAQHVDHLYFDDGIDSVLNHEVGHASTTGGRNLNCLIGMGLATGVSPAFSIDDTADFVAGVGEAGPTKRQLTVHRDGVGAVTATSSAGSLNFQCSTPTDPCTVQVGYEAGVTLTVAPTPGSDFTGWSGLPCSSPTPDVCTLVMTNDLTVTAGFEPTRHTMAVERTGIGNGVVSATQDGAAVTDFACPTVPTDDCAGTVSFNSEVELTATPDEYHTFVGWDGPFSCEAGTEETVCRFTVDEPTDLTMTAQFGLSRRVIGVEIPKGGGSGAVAAFDSAGDPLPGYNCLETAEEVTCGVEVDYGTLVTLTGTPDAGSLPATWSGAPCELGSPAGSCVIAAVGPDVSKIGADILVVANFDEGVLDTLSRTITGNGSVTAADAAGQDPLASCTPTATTCSAEVPRGTVVTLTATPATGATFQGWSGPCAAGTPAEVCVVTMAGDTSVTAAFGATTPATNPLAGLLQGLTSALSGLLGALGGLGGS